MWVLFGVITLALTIRALPGQGLPPGITEQDGVLVMEDDGSLLFRDVPLTLRSPASISFSPNALNSFDAQSVSFSYVTEIGQLMVDRTSYNDWQLVTLPFAFPFGGNSYQAVRVSRFGGIRLGDSPGPPMQRADGSFYHEQPYDLIDCFSDQAPRIFPIFIGAIHSRYGWWSGETAAYASVQGNQVTFTWRGVGFDSTSSAPVDFQLTLLPSGVFQVNYRHLEGAQYGTFAAITGRESWWNSGHSLTTVGPSDGLASKFVKAITIRQYGDTDVLAVSIDLNVSASGITDSSLQVGVQFASQSGASLGRIYLSLAAGILDSFDPGALQETVEPARLNSYGLSYAPAVNGDNVTLYLPMSLLSMTSGSYQASFFVNGADGSFSAINPITVQVNQPVSCDLTKLPLASSGTCQEF